MGREEDVETAFARLRHLFSIMQTRMREGTSAHGLTPAQALLLHALRERGRATPKELAQALHVSQPNITLHLDRLEKEGYVVRTRSNEDKRVQYVRLTEKSFDKSRELYDAAIEDVARLLAPLSDKDLARFNTILKTLTEEPTRAK